jgi:hypothetical protein
MNLVRTCRWVVAPSVGAVASVSHSEEQQPQTSPTRDVDITYRITRPGQPVIATISDQNRGAIAGEEACRRALSRF